MIKITFHFAAIDSFGDLKLNGTGKSMGGLMSNSSVNPDGSVRGVVGVQGMGNGANKSISVNDGVRVGDGNGVPIGKFTCHKFWNYLGAGIILARLIDVE